MRTGIGSKVGKILQTFLGVIYIFPNHQWSFRNDYAIVIFALSNAEFDYGMGEGV